MKTNQVELLAPAGNMAALHAAVAGGADAVYLGLEAFNARRGADNFTLETLREACDFAHLRGVSIYVTMNTIILPDEVGEALECVRQAYRAGADGFIVQDIGLAAEISRTLPEASRARGGPLRGRAHYARPRGVAGRDRPSVRGGGRRGDGSGGVRPRRVVRVLLGPVLHVLHDRRPLGQPGDVRASMSTSL